MRLLPPRDPVERQKWSYAHKTLACGYFGLALGLVIGGMGLLVADNLGVAVLVGIAVAAGSGLTLRFQIRNW
jgi:hypothetical protein